MKSFSSICALLLTAGALSAQQYTITTIAGVPQVQGYYPQPPDVLPASVAQLYKPQRIAFDSKGNYYISDFYTAVVRQVTASDNNIHTIAGNGVKGFSGDNAAATSANISDIHGIAADSNGNVYISDTANGRVRKIDSKGVITTFAGNDTKGYTGDGAMANAASLWFPAGLALDSGGNLYVADYGNSTVRKITSSGAISTVAGTGSYGFSGDGSAANKAALASPASVAVDAAGNIYIGDVSNANIRKVTTDGNIRTIATGVAPQSIAVDAAGNVYFVDGLTPVVQKLLPSGSILTIAGTGRAGYCCDGGQATLAQLDHPGGVAVDAAGNIYVADTNNQIIRKMTPVGFSIGAVANSASNAFGAIAPGEIVTLFGSGIGPSTLTTFTVSNGSLPTQIAGASASFNGIAAPLIYTSSNVVAAIAPYELVPGSNANIVITYNGNNSATTVAPVTSAAPGIFTANSTGSGQAAAVNQDGSLNSASNPAKVGSFIALYISGAGQTNPGGVNGKIVTSAPYPTVNQPVKVTIGGVTAVLNYMGQTPSSVAGLTQINAQIPTGIQTGSAVPVTVQVGTASAQAGVTIAVQ